MSQQHHVPANQLSAGERFFFAAYGKVTRIAHDDVYCEMDHGAEWRIGKRIFEQKVYSADYVHASEKVTRTEMARMLHNAGQNIFRVVFTKANGEKRTLYGHLKHSEELMGRASVIDLEVADKNANSRQVDYRTIEELTLCGVHYTLK